MATEHSDSLNISSQPSLANGMPTQDSDAQPLNSHAIRTHAVDKRAAASLRSERRVLEELPAAAVGNLAAAVARAQLHCKARQGIVNADVASVITVVDRSSAAPQIQGSKVPMVQAAEQLPGSQAPAKIPSCCLAMPAFAATKHMPVVQQQFGSRTHHRAWSTKAGNAAAACAAKQGCEQGKPAVAHVGTRSSLAQQRPSSHQTFAVCRPPARQQAQQLQLNTAEVVGKQTAASGDGMAAPSAAPRQSAPLQKRVIACQGEQYNLRIRSPCQHMHGDASHESIPPGPAISGDWQQPHCNEHFTSSHRSSVAFPAIRRILQRRQQQQQQGQLSSSHQPASHEGGVAPASATMPAGLTAAAEAECMVQPPVASVEPSTLNSSSNEACGSTVDRQTSVGLGQDAACRNQEPACSHWSSSSDDDEGWAVLKPQQVSSSLVSSRTWSQLAQSRSGVAAVPQTCSGSQGLQVSVQEGGGMPEYQALRAWRQQRNHAAALIQATVRTYLPRRKQDEGVRVMVLSRRLLHSRLARMLAEWQCIAQRRARLAVRCARLQQLYGPSAHLHLRARFDATEVLEEGGRYAYAAAWWTWRCKAAVWLAWLQAAVCRDCPPNTAVMTASEDEQNYNMAVQVFP